MFMKEAHRVFPVFLSVSLSNGEHHTKVHSKICQLKLTFISRATRPVKVDSRRVLFCQLFFRDSRDI